MPRMLKIWSTLMLFWACARGGRVTIGNRPVLVTSSILGDDVYLRSSSGKLQLTDSKNDAVEVLDEEKIAFYFTEVAPNTSSGSFFRGGASGSNESSSVPSTAEMQQFRIMNKYSEPLVYDTNSRNVGINAGGIKDAAAFSLWHLTLIGRTGEVVISTGNQEDCITLRQFKKQSLLQPQNDQGMIPAFSARLVLRRCQLGDPSQLFRLFVLEEIPTTNFSVGGVNGKRLIAESSPSSNAPPPIHYYSNPSPISQYNLGSTQYGGSGAPAFGTPSSSGGPNSGTSGQSYPGGPAPYPYDSYYPYNSTQNSDGWTSKIPFFGKKKKHHDKCKECSGRGRDCQGYDCNFYNRPEDGAWRLRLEDRMEFLERALIRELIRNPQNNLSALRSHTPTLWPRRTPKYRGNPLYPKMYSHLVSYCPPPMHSGVHIHPECLPYHS